MLRAVLDANVFVSAAINPHGRPAEVVAAFDSFDLVVSAAILVEIWRVLLYPKIARRLGWSPEQVREFLHDLANIAISTPGKLTLHVVTEDPADDRYLEAAVEGDASYVVSGDAHLLRLKEFRGIRMVTPQEFLRALGDQSR